MKRLLQNPVTQLATLALVAGLALALVGPTVPGPAALAQDKKDKDKDKDKGKDPKVPDKKKEAPKDKTPPVLVLKAKDKDDKASDGHSDWVYSAAFSADGKFLVTASRDRSVKVWDLKDGKVIATFKGHPDPVRAAFFTPDGSQVITTTAKREKVTIKVDKKDAKRGDKKIEKKETKLSGEVRIWDVKSSKMVRSFNGHTSFIDCAALSNDGKLLVTGSDDQTAIIWDVKDGKALQTLKPGKTAVWSVAFNKDGTQVVTGCLAPMLPPPDPKKKTNPTAADEVLVKVWNVADGKEAQGLKGPERDVSSVAFSPDGSFIAAGSKDGKIYLWGKDGKLAKKLEAQEGVLSISFSHDGKYLAAGGWEDTTKVWDVASGKEQFFRNGHEKSVLSVLFSPDDQRLITTGMDRTVKVWEIPKK